MSAGQTSTLSRQYAKLCDLQDFRDPDLLEAIRSLIPERDALEHIERKVWEYAMVMLFLEETGHFNDSSQVLSVGAGDERVLFWLTNHVGWMVATDIYGQGDFAEREAQPSMLTDPAAHAPDYPWRPERLDVRWMDARALEFPDASFDAVFTVSSIEHFGRAEQVAQSAREIGRVLRPGGHAMVITDCLVRRHPIDAAPVEFAIRVASLGRRRRDATLRERSKVNQVFTVRELQRLIVRPSGLELMQPLDTTLSEETFENITISAAGGQLLPRTGQRYPFLMLQTSRSAYTSVCLPLVKPPR